jgi:hypothetical protein
MSNLIKVTRSRKAERAPEGALSISEVQENLDAGNAHHHQLTSN